MPKFEARHYNELARILRLEHEHFGKYVDEATPAEAVSDVVRVLAAYFAGDNPRFNHERFLKACGVDRKMAGDERL